MDVAIAPALLVRCGHLGFQDNAPVNKQMLQGAHIPTRLTTLYDMVLRLNVKRVRTGERVGFANPFCTIKKTYNSLEIRTLNELEPEPVRQDCLSFQIIGLGYIG